MIKEINQRRLKEILGRYYLQPLRQAGFMPDDPVVRQKLQEIFDRYDHIREKERVIRNPGGLFYSLVNRTVAHIIANETPTEVPMTDAAEKLYKDILNG